MAKRIDFSRVANKLVLIYSQHKTDNNLSVWKKEFKDILNAAEVKRLYELFSGDLQLLQSTGGRNLSWSKHANKDNFTRDWSETIFKKYGIQSVFGPTLGVDGKVLHPRTNYTRKTTNMSELIYDERTGDFVPKEQLESPIAPEGQQFDCSGALIDDLSSFTDEQLLAELQRRKEERKAAEELARKKALVEEFLAVYSLTMDDLLKIAQTKI